jgi:polar amino acid transport system substrate-binding protein
MNKILKIIVITTLIVFNSVTNAYAEINQVQSKDRFERIKEKGVLTVVSSGDRPFVYLDPKTGKYIGITVDIIHEIAKRLEIPKVEFKIYPFGELLGKLDTDNEIDMVVDRFHVTPERKKLYNFTHLLYKDYDTIVTTIYSKYVFKENLKDAVAGVLKGSIYEEIANKLKDTGNLKDVITYEHEDFLGEELINGKIDVFLTGSVNANYLAAKDPNILFKALSLNEYTPTGAGGVGFPIRKSDITLLDSVNETINDMKLDGTLQKILNKYGLDETYYL